jgi:hypothetical protein
MRGTIVLCLGCLAALSLPGTTATARLDAAQAPAQSKATPATQGWNALSVDITIRHSRVNADGAPTGVVTPAVKHHWERRLTASGWKSTMTLRSEPVVTVQGLNGRKRIENPFAITRIEDDEDGTPLRFFDRKGDQVRLPTEAELPRINRNASPSPGNEASLANTVRPLSFGRDWSDALVASPERSAARRAALERRFGKPEGRVRALDRFLSTRGDETVEVLADPQLALPVEINVVRERTLVSHTTIGYVRGAGGSVIRRSLHMERTLPDASGERTVTDVEVDNVRLEDLEDLEEKR